MPPRQKARNRRRRRRLSKRAQPCPRTAASRLRGPMEEAELELVLLETKLSLFFIRTACRCSTHLARLACAGASMRPAPSPKSSRNARTSAALEFYTRSLQVEWNQPPVIENQKRLEAARSGGGWPVLADEEACQHGRKVSKYAEGVDAQQEAKGPAFPCHRPVL